MEVRNPALILLDAADYVGLDYMDSELVTFIHVIIVAV